MRLAPPPKRFPRATLALALAYALALQLLLALSATASHVVVAPTLEANTVICPAQVEPAASQPVQPIRAEHDDLCCIACDALSPATLPISAAAFLVVQYAQATDRIRAPPDLRPPTALPRSPVQQRAPPRFV
ncbi:hypothetical protein [Methylobacterium nodulans]|uniref:hypothetical protein n=1 Tax=Methylobacterium nodulans TaxID=114616 RepID=UPI0012EE62C1|nr:hypothetical protein [Methylobacterium nodulans]